MPNAPKTPLRTVRLDDDLWLAFGNLAKDRSMVIREFIRWYTYQPGAKLPRRPEVLTRTDGEEK